MTKLPQRIKWGYKKGKGRWYQRKTGTKRFPDTGDIVSDGRKVGTEKIGLHHYGQDKGTIRKKRSKVYARHSFKSKKGRKAYRGGYTRRLR